MLSGVFLVKLLNIRATFDISGRAHLHAVCEKEDFHIQNSVFWMKSYYY